MIMHRDNRQIETDAPAGPCRIRHLAPVALDWTPETHAVDVLEFFGWRRESEKGARTKTKGNRA